MDFSSFSDSEEEMKVWQDMDKSTSDDFQSEFESIEDEFDYLTYRNYPDPYVNTPVSPSDDKKTKKKKRRKGRGLLIAGTAIYLALQLMK